MATNIASQVQTWFKKSNTEKEPPDPLPRETILLTQKELISQVPIKSRAIARKIIEASNKAQENFSMETGVMDEDIYKIRSITADYLPRTIQAYLSTSEDKRTQEHADELVLQLKVLHRGLQSKVAQYTKSVHYELEVNRHIISELFPEEAKELELVRAVSVPDVLALGKKEDKEETVESYRERGYTNQAIILLLAQKIKKDIPGFTEVESLEKDWNVISVHNKNREFESKKTIYEISEKGSDVTFLRKDLYNTKKNGYKETEKEDSYFLSEEDWFLEAYQFAYERKEESEKHIEEDISKHAIIENNNERIINDIKRQFTNSGILGEISKNSWAEGNKE